MELNPPDSFSRPSEAWAQIPKGALVRVFENTGGRPRLMRDADGNRDWTESKFMQALADGVLPKVPYIFRPLSAPNKMSSQKIGLNLHLDMSSESVTIGSPADAEMQQGAAQQSFAGGYVQTEVMGAFLGVLKDERSEKWELLEENKALRDELAEIKLRLVTQEFEYKLSRAADNDSLSAMFNKTVIELARGPGGAIAVAKVLGVSNEGMAAALADAAKRAAGSG